LACRADKKVDLIIDWPAFPPFACCSPSCGMARFAG
jgi:hypothetical protein